MQISQEAGRVVWYSHLCQNFPQFVVIHTVNILIYNFISVVFSRYILISKKVVFSIVSGDSLTFKYCS